MKEKWKKDKKFRRNCILAGFILVSLLGTSVYTLFVHPNLSTETYVYKEETVVRGNLILGIMESGETVHENRLRSGIFHYPSVNLIGGQLPDPFLPDALRLSHGNPTLSV